MLQVVHQNVSKPVDLRPNASQGRYYGPNCKLQLCDNPAGYYYLQAAQEGNKSCAQVRSKCTNVGRGETYAQSNGIVTAPDGCNVTNCTPSPEIGKYLAVPGLILTKE